MSKVVTRIAPSPTGYLHFGLARTALFNYLYARKMGGEFVCRIEDTDTARNKPEYEEDIIEQFAWLGLLPDRAYRQSEHLARHQECLSDLIAGDKAYVSKEPAKDDPSRTVEVIRLRNAGETITFTDLVRGDISFDTAELKDFVIARSIDEPLYHFAVVVDDHDEGITHVVRGDDHISNTPRQILIQRALGFDTPAYAHLPLILMPDKSKMSKRKHETSLQHYRKMGILPQAILNYLALLGWTPPSGSEVLSLEEMAAEFELSDLHKSGAIFDIEKLRWFNREYLHKMRSDDFEGEALRELHDAISARGLAFDENIAHKIMPLVRERISTWGDIAQLGGEGEFDFFFADPQLSPETIPQKGSTATETREYLEHVQDLMKNLPEEDFTRAESIKTVIWPYAEEKGRGNVLWPLRYALSGRQKSPDPFEISCAIGKDAVVRRIARAIRELHTRQ